MDNNEKKRIGLDLLAEVDKLLVNNNIWYSLSYGSALGAYREHGFIEWDPDIDIIISIDDQARVRRVLKEGLSDAFAVVSCDCDNVSSYDIVVKKGVFEGDFHIDLYPLVGGPDNIKKGHRFQMRCRRIHSLAKCKHVNLKRIKKKWKLPFVIVIKGVLHLIPDRTIRSYIQKTARKYPFDSSKYVFPFANDGKTGEYMVKSMLVNTNRVTFENMTLPIPVEIDNYLSSIYGKNYMTPIKY